MKYVQYLCDLIADFEVKILHVSRTRYFQLKYLAFFKNRYLDIYGMDINFTCEGQGKDLKLIIMNILCRDVDTCIKFDTHLTFGLFGSITLIITDGLLRFTGV